MATHATHVSDVCLHINFQGFNTRWDGTHCHAFLCVHAAHIHIHTYPTSARTHAVPLQVKLATVADMTAAARELLVVEVLGSKEDALEVCMHRISCSEMGGCH